MSNTIQREVWKLDLPPSEKLVLLRLADHADKHDCSYPSVRSLSGTTGLSERQIQRYLKGFVEAGYVAIDDNAKGGRGKTRVYRFIMGKGVTSDVKENPQRVTPKVTKGDTQGTSKETKGDTQGKERVTPKAVKGDTFARTDTEPPKNPQEEPPTTRPMPRQGPAQTLTATLYEDVLGIGAPTGYKQVVGQAQTLVNAGCTPDELREIAEWLQSDSFWATKGVTMGLILSKRDNWRSAKNAPATSRASPNGKGSGRNGGYTVAELYAMSGKDDR